MSRVVPSAIVFAVMLFGQAIVPAPRAAAVPVSLSQVIEPLTCTVDTIAIGPTLIASLAPAECIHSAAARQLLARTAATLHANAAGYQ